EKVTHENFDLIFMDIVMPELNGLEATAEIRKKEKEKGRPQVPIVALSGNAMSEDIQASKTVGCNAHLAKPVRKEELIEMLSRFLPTETPAV
ncbi:MAG TPA: response regulator, partial [Turneriella sp.]|nr:response regulator [Turneriella sp.]